MSEVEVKKIVEALLFVSEKPITMKQITEVCDKIEVSQIKEALKDLKEEYAKNDRGIQIVEVAGGYQFCTNPDCAAYIKKLYKTRRVWRLSGPSLETLAIIAYKQPVTRSEIEFIRGVNVDGVVKTLSERGLIKIKGRKDVPGKPILYGTTEEFLQYFGLKSLQDLPTLEEFTAQALENESSDGEEDVENIHLETEENNEHDMPEEPSDEVLEEEENNEAEPEESQSQDKHSKIAQGD
ncbi:MAG: SMC-Scp complex subunit ScpB [Candidatus Omnitrophota bacterium]